MIFNISNKLNLNDKNSLSRIIIYLLSRGILTYMILFVTSILIFRNVDKSDYGLYVVLMSLFAIVELFMGGYNQAIARYLKEDIPLIDKQQIILYTFYYKYILLVVFLSILFILKNYGLLKYLINNYKSVESIINYFLEITVLNSIILVMIGISSTILTSLYQYRFVTTMSIIRNLSYLFVVVGLIFITDDYLIYLYSSFLLSIILLMIYAYKIISLFPEYSILTLIKIKLDFSIYKRYLMTYASPLTAVSLLTYAKNQLPIIILGKEFELADVAIFSIIKKLFKALHSLIGSFLGSLTSKFVTIQKDKNKFIKVMNILYYGTFIIRVSIYLVMILMLKYFFIIYKLDDNITNRLVFYILGLEFVVAGIMNSFGVLLTLKTTTKYILYISIGRFIVEISLIYLLLLHYGILGAALILLLSRFFETTLSYAIIKKDKVIKFGFLNIILILPFVIYFILEVLK